MPNHSIVDTSEICKYLEDKGWERVEVIESFVFVNIYKNKESSIGIVMDKNSRLYAISIRQAINSLADFEGRSRQIILKEILQGVK